MTDKDDQPPTFRAQPNLDDLRVLLRLAYDHLAATGREMTATELRVSLRRS